MEIPPVQVPPTAPPIFDTTGRVCLRCGYELTGLPVSGQCPECGTPIERSLHGNLLRYSAPEYLRKLHIGVFLVLASIVAMIFAMVLAVAAVLALDVFEVDVPGALEVLPALVGVVISFGSMIGWWLLSEPDPAFIGAGSGGRARQLIRTMVAFNAGATVIVFIAEDIMGYSADAMLISAGELTAILVLAVNVLVLVIFAVQYFASMVYVQWLARRIPHTGIEQRAKKLMWLGPLLYFPGCLIVVGPIIALLLYWRLLNTVRQEFRRIREEEGHLPVGD